MASPEPSRSLPVLVLACSSAPPPPPTIDIPRGARRLGGPVGRAHRRPGRRPRRARARRVEAACAQHGTPPPARNSGPSRTPPPPRTRQCHRAACPPVTSRRRLVSTKGGAWGRVFRWETMPRPGAPRTAARRLQPVLLSPRGPARAGVRLRFGRREARPAHRHGPHLRRPRRPGAGRLQSRRRRHGKS